MDLICPDCRQILEVDAQNAVCTAHDGHFQVLFDRGTAFVAEAPKPAAVPSAGVPQAAYEIETKACQACGVLNPMSAAFCRSCRSQFSLWSAMSAPQPSVNKIHCTQHPDVPAVMRCQVCHSGVCATCDFVVPGGVHVCPACIEKEPSNELEPARRNKMIAGFFIAAYSTLMLALGRSGALVRTFGNDKDTLKILGLFIFWPMVIGVGVSLAALDKRRGNTTSIIVGVVWNCINLGLLLLLNLLK